MRDFRLRNIELQSPDGKDAASRLVELSAQYETAKLALREAEQARDAAKAALAAERGQAANVGTQSLLQESALAVSTPEIDARIEAQRRNLDTMLQRFTERHPDVASARRVIKDLEEQKKKEVAELRKAAMSTSGSVPGVTASLAAQELNRVLATSEVQVASLRARVSEFGARYNQAKAMLERAPQLEAEAAQLNRDYAIHKKNYEDLVGRREAASMSGDLEVAAGLADFRLIDPPRVSPKPVSPNRLLLLPLALVAALAAGLFIAFAMSQLRPVFHRAADLREKFELPLLGVVSRVLTDADRRRHRTDALRFSAATGGLIGIFVLGIAALLLTAGR